MSEYLNEWSLPALGVDPNLVVACGVSSGGYTSSQLHVVYSERIKGAGIIIGGSYMSGKYAFQMADLSWEAKDYNANLDIVDQFSDSIFDAAITYEV